MSSIAAAVRRFVRDNFLFGQEPTFSDRDSFLDQGIVDSTGVLELVTFLEEQYEITIADEELVPENLDSIDNVVRFVESKRQPAVSPSNQAGTLGAILDAGLVNPGLSEQRMGEITP